MRFGYGLTETAPLLAGAAPSQVRLGSTGPAAPGVQLRLENVNPDTQQGEIVALTPSVMLGYYKNPEETAKVFTPDGWFRTGDLGWLSPDGWLYIKGRLKNMIVGPSGENIYPEEIESVLNSHVFVADSLVTEKEGRAHRARAFQPRRAGSALRGAEIRLGDEEGRMGRNASMSSKKRCSTT